MPDRAAPSGTGHDTAPEGNPRVVTTVTGVMLCAICSEPLNGAILNEDNKWVHPDCEANADWHEEHPYA